MDVVAWKTFPTKQKAQSKIRELVERGCIRWSKQAKERMQQREVTMPQIINCLLKGSITELTYSYRAGGGYEARIERVTAGDMLRVVVCLKWNEELLIITVIT